MNKKMINERHVVGSEVKAIVSIICFHEAEFSKGS
jgi:hypothetical protein